MLINHVFGEKGGAVCGIEKEKRKERRKKKTCWAMLNSKASVGDYLCLPTLHHKAAALLSPGWSEKRCPIAAELQAITRL